jgi:hypothetical protein
MPGVRSPEGSGLRRGRLSPLPVGRSNSGMHPTADTLLVKFSTGVARRVMPALDAPMYAAYVAKEN